jgi:hypothetical protein
MQRMIAARGEAAGVALHVADTTMKGFSKTTAVLLISASLGLLTPLHGADRESEKAKSGSGDESLPQKEIESIVGLEGEMQHGVLELQLGRKDMSPVDGPKGTGVTLKPSFELDGEALFQPLSKGGAFVNGDICLKEEEVNPFISALMDNGLVFQAFHQHVPTHPQTWFVHFRGEGDPLALARGFRKALDTTSTPLPQKKALNPTSPLDSKRLGEILHGDASIGDDGVVAVWVLRKDRVTIDGVHVNPRANISTNIEFYPTSGDEAQIVADFSLKAKQVQPVIHLMMHELGWYQGCLYNQETDEQPQLYFDHMVKTGDAYKLAAEIRRGLDLTDAEGSKD